MTLFSSFYSGLSGLNTYSLAMNVIGNNIANINTVGFKSGISTFQDLFSRTISGSQRAFQVGLGVTLSDVNTSLAQGALESTASPLDVAIQGNGMFILKENLDSNNFLYTRAGNFGINGDGYLVTASGLLVQGWQAEGGVIDINKALQAIQVQSGQVVSAFATDRITLIGNMNAEEELVDFTKYPTTADINPEISESYNFKQTMRIYDSLGGEHTLQICFRKLATVTAPAPAESEWEYAAFIDGDELETPQPDTWVSIESGTLAFNDSGALLSVTQINNTPIQFKDAAANQDIIFNFGSPINDTPPGSGLDGITQMVSETSAISFYTQNGYGTGELESVTVDAKGVITGFFSNGQTRPLAQIALASFANYAGLNKLGNNIFGETFDSGSAIPDEAGTGGRGKMVANALEMSNVDLAREFTSMIVGQRGYQANSRIISTTDEMIQEVLMIKR